MTCEGAVGWEKGRICSPRAMNGPKKRKEPLIQVALFQRVLLPFLLLSPKHNEVYSITRRPVAIASSAFILSM
jgi:hypothetical protein